MVADADHLDSVGLLEEDEVEKGHDHLNAHFKSKRTWSIQYSTAIIFLLLATNALLLLASPSFLWSEKHSEAELKRDYFGAAATTQVPFSHQWIGLDTQEVNGYRYKDEEWDGFFPKHGGIVALSSNFRIHHKLPENAAHSPEEEDKKLYYIAGYHQMHCLQTVRDAIYYLNGTMEWPNSDGFIWDHVLHCIEAVRLGLSCFLDPTLINLNETWPGIPNGQMHECRNRDALHAFAEENGHPAPVDPREIGA